MLRRLSRSPRSAAQDVKQIETGPNLDDELPTRKSSQPAAAPAPVASQTAFGAPAAPAPAFGAARAAPAPAFGAAAAAPAFGAPAAQPAAFAAAPVAQPPQAAAVPVTGASIDATPNLSKNQKLELKRRLLNETEAKVNKINADLHNAEGVLAELHRTQRVNRVTGVGEDLNGNSIAKLEVTIFEGRNFPKMDMFSGKADPYVKLIVTPKAASGDNADKRTEIKWKNLNPVFNQNFTFQPILNINATLVLEVYDAEKVGSDEYIAQVAIPFAEMAHQQEEEKWYAISDPTQQSACQGAITGELRVKTRFTFCKIQPLERAIQVHSAQRDQGMQLIEQLRKEIREMEGVGAFFKMPAAGTPAAPVAVVDSPPPPPGELRRRTLTETALDWLHNDLEEEYGLQKILFPTPGTVEGQPEVVQATDCVVM